MWDASVFFPLCHVKLVGSLIGLADFDHLVEGFIYCKGTFYFFSNSKWWRLFGTV